MRLLGRHKGQNQMSSRLVDPYGSVETHEKQSGVNAVRLHVTANYAGVADFTVGLVGKFQRLTIKPGAGGVQPDAGFDLAITDEHGVSLYSNTNLSQSSVTIAYPSTSNPIVVHGNCRFLFGGMGDTKECEVICYFEP